MPSWDLKSFKSSCRYGNTHGCRYSTWQGCEATHIIKLVHIMLRGEVLLTLETKWGLALTLNITGTSSCGVTALPDQLSHRHYFLWFTLRRDAPIRASNTWMDSPTKLTLTPGKQSKAKHIQECKTSLSVYFLSVSHHPSFRHTHMEQVTPVSYLRSQAILD